MAGDRDDLDMRRVTDADMPAVLALLEASLGWVPDEQHAAFFDWKHRANPFGESPAWVAVDGDRIVGFRTFLRWEFERAGEVVRAVRAVDTATHPDYQGRGIFSKLTRHALDEMRSEGVGFVFNTPNDQSRPGYLKMGWQDVGRLPVHARPRSVGALLRLARARVPADKWSQPSDAGVAAAEALDDHDAVAALLERCAPPLGFATRRTSAFLAWRYGFAPLAYRAMSTDDGMVLFRLRRRGPAVEATIADLLVMDRRAAGPMLRRVVRESGADYAIVLGERAPGFVPVPKQGPRLTWREVTEAAMPALADWSLVLGDVELF